MDLKRRTLLKVLGTVAAGSVLPGCDREVHRLVPYLLPDDEIVPGLDTWYASVCRQCEAGCGILVRTREGRAKKIEGNPSHPVSGGKVCARGQAVVQELYHPDRLRGPLRRTGKRGSGQYEPLTWDEAIELWVTHLAEHSGASAMLSRPIPGTLEDVFTGFFNSIGGQVLFYEPATELPTKQAERAVFGCPPYYDMAHCDYLLSFGAPFLDHWQSPVACGRAFGAMRQDRPTRRGRFIQIEPRLSLTAASADEWIALRPGTEGLVALGIGQILLELGRPSLPPADAAAFASAYRRYPLTDVAAQSEVPEATLRRVAHELASAAAPLIIGGGTAASYTKSASVMTAILALNRLLGNLGKPGGVRLFKPSGFVHGRETPLGDRAVVDLLTTFETGESRILHLYQTDPIYALPPSTQCRRLLEHAELIISFSSFLDDTTAMADLILPDHTSLEAWAEVADPPMAPMATVGLAQPVVLPLYDTRAVGDVWLDAATRLAPRLSLAKRKALQMALPWQTMWSTRQARWQSFLARGTHPQEFEQAWHQVVRQGGWWAHDPVEVGACARMASLSYDAPHFAGDAGLYPFYFMPYPSVLGQGREANLPWLQELPDTLTTAVWGSWIELNPETARQHGIRQGDVVRVVSPVGALEAPVIYFPGLRPDVVSAPMGQGHEHYGRYAAGRGTNAGSILMALYDSETGALARSATRVRLELTGRVGGPVLLDKGGRFFKREGSEESSPSLIHPDDPRKRAS